MKADSNGGRPLATASASGPDAVEQAVARLRAKWPGPFGAIIAVCTSDHDLARLMALLRATFGTDPALCGSTSSGGVFTEEGIVMGSSVALLAFGASETTRFGAAVAEGGPGDAWRHKAVLVAEAAAQAADRPGELPSLVVPLLTPGGEEDVLQGIHDVFGPSVLVNGGTAADADNSGAWRVAAGDVVVSQGVAMLFVFGSEAPRVSFQSGYLASAHHAVVTRAKGREIIELDRQPAAQVYRRWTEGMLDPALHEGGAFMQATASIPLGRKAGSIGGHAVYSMTHPSALTPRGTVQLFTQILEGQEVVLMTGTVGALVDRAGFVAKSAVAAKPTSGGLMVYCAGCSMVAHSRLAEVAHQAADAFSRRPLLGWFTFGEQGPRRADGRPEHANLMISAVAFPG